MAGGKNETRRFVVCRLEPKGQQAQGCNDKVNYVTNPHQLFVLKLKPEVFEVGNSNLHNWMRYLARPPPRAEIGEGGAEIVMATILNFICFLQQFQGPPFLTRVTNPPTLLD